MLKRLKSVSMLLFLGGLSVGNTATATAPEINTPAIVQQNGACKGIVKDATGEAVIGASVVVKGTTNGTITDFDGNFSLDNVKKGDVLVISYVGYQTQEIKWNGTPLKVVLKEDSKTLSEVVVVGYGTQKKANLSGAVAQVNSEELTNRPISNVSSGLQGLMPGVTVTAGQGRPGEDGSNIRIRGVGTLNNASPYILIDGVESGSMNDLDPNDIESISVLKDASSAAIYGSKASNGVILITTKRGKTGAPRISYNGYVGFQNATATIDRVSSADYARLYNRIDDANGQPHRYSDEDIRLFENGTDPYGHPNTDWNDAAYQTGVIHKHNVNINGGTDQAKYMASIGYLGQTGILPNSERSQFNGRMNLDVNITKKLHARMNLAYIKNDYKDPNSNYGGGWSDQIIRQLNILSPMIPIKKEDGTYGQTNDGNPIAWLDSGQTVDKYNQNFTGMLSLDYEIIDGLKATVTGAYVNDDQHYKAFVKKIENDPAQAARPNSLTESFRNWNRYNFDALLNYDKQFGDHGLKVMLGYHAEAFDVRYNSMYRENFPNNELDDMNAGATATQTNSGYTRELNMLSYFGRVNYDYRGKYLFEANVRADASSRFAPGNRWGYFPSFSGAWRISEESFMEGLRENWLSNLKIRASWGQLGNQDALGNGSPTGGDFYPWLNTYSLGANYPFGGALTTGYYQGSYKIATLSWEKATTWGIGVDFTLFNKVTGSVDYYNRKTSDIIMNVSVPQEFALSAYKDNVGSMKNTGVELQLAYNDRYNDWSWGVSGNFAYNKNTIEDLGGVERMEDGSYMREVGSPIHSWFVYRTDGFFQSDEEAAAWEAKYGNPFGKKFRAGDLRYVDTDGDGKLTGSDRELYKTSDPKFTFGFNLNAGYKNVDVSMNFTGAAGVGYAFTKEAFGEFSGSAGHPSTAWLDSWTPENKNASMPRIAESRQSPSEASVVMSDFWIINTSYLRMKTFQLGYTFPKNWIEKCGIQNLRIYYSAENLLTFDSMPINVDPETVSERLSSYPLNKTHSFGVNITF
ncbi:TonB-dependent receptor [Phocaeicola sp.]|uniref:SusC/RagA family TonB-linked outer membrane protein n=1 Tax=Phocaeicola sp. TaxID=2773926 RepID=UPI0023CFBE09|nr:TonB-dependent receptor [Phocaeicola sp.]MDE5677193.1 TonB-dependent receptor [Phocaeicola sp.]